MQTREEADRFQPYPPGWVNLLVDWVEKRASPYWMFYLFLGLFIIVLQAWIKWSDGSVPRGSFDLPLVLFAGAGVYALALMHHLIRMVPNAMVKMRPAISESSESYRALVYKMTYAQALPVLVATLAGIAFGLYLNYLLQRASTPVLKLATSPVSAAFDGILMVFTWGVLGAGVYSLFYLLGSINNIYLHHTRINIFAAQPLYAPAGLASRAALGIALYNLPWMVLTPGASSVPAIVGLTMLFQVIAAAVFVVPLFGAHQLLLDDKNRRQQTANAKFEILIKDLHQKVDSGDSTNIDALQKTMALVQLEQTTLDKTPTWPWNPETMRIVISAILVPMLIWLAQRLLGRLGGLGG